MDNDDFTDALAERLGSRNAADAAVRAFVEVVHDELAHGGRVALTGFGVFEPAKARGLPGDRVRVHFRPGTAFRAMVHAGPESLRAPAAPSGESRLGSQSACPPAAQGSPPTPRKVGREAAAPSRKLAFRHYSLPGAVSLSAVLPEESARCGIYVLHFADGQRYVGQARDVMTRIASHRRRWEGQITGLDFAPAAPSALDDLERRTIQSLEREGVDLRNSALVGLPMGESPLDLVIDRVEQDLWLEGVAVDAYDLDARVATALRRRRTGRNFATIRARHDYEGIRTALLFFLIDVVPWPHETERRFWSLTSMPSTNRSRLQRRVSVLSVNNVETLVIAEAREGDDWVLSGFINVSPNLLTSAELDWPLERHRYRTVGDVDTIYFVGWQDLVALLERSAVRDAARRLNLGLMRKGRGMMAKYHDESLADDVFALLAEVGGE